MGALPSRDSDRETPRMPQRLLNIDPRSPTEGIDRTPIMVDATPLQTRTAAAEESTKVQLNNLFDPRSPHENKCRTPLTMSPIRFDFSELESALKRHQESQGTPLVDSPAKVVDEVATPPTTPLKPRVVANPLSVRSPNITRDSPLAKREWQTPSGKHRLRQVAHHNQAKNKVLQDENAATPRPIRL